MIVRLVQRIGILLASLVVSSVLVFAFMAVLPGIRPASPSVSARRTRRWRNCASSSARPAARGPVLQLGQGTGDLRPGNSYISQTAIGPQIADRLQVTLWLVGVGMALACVLAIPMGTLMAVRHRKPSGLLLSALSRSAWPSRPSSRASS